MNKFFKFFSFKGHSPAHLPLHVKDGKVLREVADTDEAVSVIYIMKECGYYGKNVVETRVYSKKQNLLEHKLISPIIYSGEYSVSMAYDVSEFCLRMGEDALIHSLYAYDLLPHNFTFYDGEWLLYDFGAFEQYPFNFKTQARGTFKITFAAFELLKMLDRAELGQYFLNRISAEKLVYMVSLNRYFIFEVKLLFVKILYHLKLYGASYKFMKYLLRRYRRVFRRKVYSFDSDFEHKNNEAFSLIEKILNENGVNNIFSVGEMSAAWALKNADKYKVSAYLDSYDTCDEIYNYIRKNNIKNIIPAVVYPFIDDAKIPLHYKFRALYDDFAKERFISDVVINLNFEDLLNNKDGVCSAGVRSVVQNLSDFSDKLIILKVKSTFLYINDVKEALCKIFERVDTYNCKGNALDEDGNDIIFAASLKKKSCIQKKEKCCYGNENRIALAEKHSDAIIKILTLKRSGNSSLKQGISSTIKRHIRGLNVWILNFCCLFQSDLFFELVDELLSV